MDYGIVHSKAYKTEIVKVAPDVVLVKRYYYSGQLKFEGEYKQMPEVLRDEPVGITITCEEPFEFKTLPYTKEGISIWFHENGQVFKKVYYRKGLEDGPVDIWHANGQLMECGEIDNGKRIDTWEYYTEQGRLYKKEHYHDNGSEEELL